VLASLESPPFEVNLPTMSWLAEGPMGNLFQVNDRVPSGHTVDIALSFNGPLPIVISERCKRSFVGRSDLGSTAVSAPRMPRRCHAVSISTEWTHSKRTLCAWDQRACLISAIPCAVFSSSQTRARTETPFPPSNILHSILGHQ